jgi:reactive intermediate/imine deaminase
MAHQFLQPKTVHKPTGYSHAARVGDMLYVAGQIALDRSGKLVGKGDIEAQTKQVFTNLQNVLKEAGGTMKHVVKTMTFITHPGHLEPYRKVRGQFLTEPFPCNTLLVVESLASPDYLIEIEAIAALER